MRNLIDILDLSTKEIESLIDTAKDIIANPENYNERCKNKKLGVLFFEPSTRTRLSFEAAMMELGGKALGFSDASSSSTSKGECVGDTARIVSGYADIIAMRHPKEGAPLVASMSSDVPIINAGDGGHHHPTQTLTDLLTISRELGRLDNLTVGFCGDLMYGRTVHSLIAAMSRYENIKFVLISPKELRLPNYVKEDYLDAKNVSYVETESLEDAIPELDVLYMTRVQQERFIDINEYLRLKDVYILDTEKLKGAKEDMIVLHPLPRLNEITKDVDNDKRAAYFRQARNGKYMRMALILKLLDSVNESNAEDTAKFRSDLVCENPRCITSVEQDIPHRFKLTEKGTYRCIYCDAEKK